MIERLIRLALHHPWAVLVATVGIVSLGIYSYQHQKIDAYPDISGQMVQILTTYPGRAPEEVEQQVTIPIELAMGNVPRVTTIRSRTIFGLSVVQLMFERRNRDSNPGGTSQADVPCLNEHPFPGRRMALPDR